MAAVTVPIINNQSQMLTSSPGLIAGYSMRETAGARAIIQFRDGADTASDANLLVTISLNPLESTRDWFMPTGILCRYGLYAEIVAGQIVGSAQYVFGGAQ